MESVGSAFTTVHVGQRDESDVQVAASYSRRQCIVEHGPGDLIDIGLRDGIATGPEGVLDHGQIRVMDPFL